MIHEEIRLVCLLAIYIRTRRAHERNRDYRQRLLFLRTVGEILLLEQHSVVQESKSSRGLLSMGGSMTRPDISHKMPRRNASDRDIFVTAAAFSPSTLKRHVTHVRLHDCSLISRKLVRTSIYEHAVVQPLLCAEDPRPV